MKALIALVSMKEIPINLWLRRTTAYHHGFFPMHHVLQDGTKIYDYKALNVINRVEAFTWEGSEKGMYYKEGDPSYGRPRISSMEVMAYRK